MDLFLSQFSFVHSDMIIFTTAQCSIGFEVGKKKLLDRDKKLRQVSCCRG